MNTQLSQILIWLVCFWTMSCPARAAESYSLGMEAYRAGEFPKAYKILSKVAKKSKNKTDKASAVALMAASAAKLNKKAKAEALFNKAIKLDPTLSLSKEIAKDKNVNKLFTSAKKNAGGEAVTASSENSVDSSEGENDKGSGFGIRAFMPLGIGFYLNNKTGKGLIYGGLQVAGLAGVFLYGTSVTKGNADAKAVGSQLQADKDAGRTIDQTAYKFLDDNEKFVKSAQNLQTASLGLFLLSYGVSIVDAIYWSGPSTNQASTTQEPNAKGMEKTIVGNDEAPSSRSWNLKLMPDVSAFGIGTILAFDRKF